MASIIGIVAMTICAIVIRLIGSDHTNLLDSQLAINLACAIGIVGLVAMRVVTRERD